MTSVLCPVSWCVSCPGSPSPSIQEELGAGQQADLALIPLRSQTGLPTGLRLPSLAEEQRTGLRQGLERRDGEGFQ